MKSKDISLIVVIAVVSAVISVILSGLIVPSSDRNQSVEVVEPISADFNRPPEEYFNSNSVNPTREIQIQVDPNSNPFGS